MSFLDTLFLKKQRPKPSPFVDDSSDTIAIEIHSTRYLSEDQQNAIISVIISDVRNRAKLEDMAIDVVTYSGLIEPVHIIRTPDTVKVLIG